ncbi:MAG: recombinase RecX [Flavobacteriales bacterium]|nr:recombinase RecX [Flavobacteriales bacterium]|tara:strand:- start:946 stop:1413 length:468 start_codon:yes stop_codon:yes gene_type:complete
MFTNQEENTIKKLKKNCAESDKCQFDIIKKMSSLRIQKPVQKKILNILVKENFINEARYAKTYCRGKFRINKWGKQKIINSLKIKNISSKNINNGLKEIHEESYISLINDLICRKNEKLNKLDMKLKKEKIAKFLLQKGFESPLIWKSINNLITK